ncbi:MAG: DUF3501 family protein [Candidatus Hodarchaeales archaeon]|jgi:hypothetical protein
MGKVQRKEILDYVTYNEKRSEYREKIMKEKKIRRIHVGDYLTFLFENHDTMWYQIQEMLRAEKIVKETDIQHEIDTYNELVGIDGNLGCSLLIEIDSKEEREKRLTKWLDLPKKVYVKTEDGEKIRPLFDERQMGEDRLSSVQYLMFETKGKVPIAVGAEMPEFSELNHETTLNSKQKEALKLDLEP